jgi:hypothetical protein
MQLLLPSDTAALNAAPVEGKQTIPTDRSHRARARQSLFNAGPLAKPGPAFDLEEDPAQQGSEPHAVGVGQVAGLAEDSWTGADGEGDESDDGGVGDFAFDDVRDEELPPSDLFHGANAFSWV